MVNVRKKVGNNIVLAAYTCEQEEKKGICIGVKNSKEIYDCICAVECDSDGKCTLTICEDIVEDLNASVCKENHDNSKPLMQKYLVFIDSEYIRDAQVFFGSETEDKLSVEMSDNWLDTDKADFYIGTYLAISEENACSQASEKEGYHIETLRAEIR